MADEAKILQLLTLTDIAKPMLMVLSANVRLWSHDFQDKDVADDVVAGVDVYELLQRFVPVYANALDDETTDRAVELFSTPAGRKFIAAHEEIMLRITKVTHDYGLELVARDGIRERLELRMSGMLRRPSTARRRAERAEIALAVASNVSVARSTDRTPRVPRQGRRDTGDPNPAPCSSDQGSILASAFPIRLSS